MRSNLLPLTLTLLLAWLPVGCGRKSLPGQTVLVFQQGALSAKSDALGRLLQQFQEQNPDIQVELKTLSGSLSDQKKSCAQALAKKSDKFDLFTLDVTWNAELAQAGWLRELSPEFQPAERDEFFHAALQACLYQGRLAALPWLMDAGLLYYRRDLLQAQGLKPPEAWGDLTRIASTLTAQTPGLHGFIWQGAKDEDLVCNILEYLWSNGGRVVLDNAVVLDSAENRQALNFVRNLFTKYRVTSELVRTTGAEDSLELFAQGKAVFLRHWTHAWKRLAESNSPVDGKVGIGLLPHFPNHQPAAALGGWQLGLNPNTPHPEAALRLLRFLVSAEAQKTLAAAGLLPARRAPYEDAEMVKSQPALATFYQIFLHAQPRPISPGYAEFSNLMQAEFSAVLDRSRTPEVVLATLQEKAGKFFQREGIASPK